MRGSRGMEKLCGSSVKVSPKTFSSAKFSLGKWKSPGVQKPLVELFVLRSYKTRTRWGRGGPIAKCNPWLRARYLARGCPGQGFKRVCVYMCVRERVYEKSITIPSAIRRRVLIFKEVIELASAKCQDNSPAPQHRTLPHVARLAGAAAAAASCRQIREATRNC